MSKLSTYAWISALLGMFLLRLIKDQVQIQPTHLNESLIGQKVKTITSIKSIHESESGYFLVLDNRLATTIFTKDKINLKNDSIIEVEGTLTEFNDQLSILADQVWI